MIHIYAHPLQKDFRQYILSAIIDERVAAPFLVAAAPRHHPGGDGSPTQSLSTPRSNRRSVELVHDREREKSEFAEESGTLVNGRAFLHSILLNPSDPYLPFIFPPPPYLLPRQALELRARTMTRGAATREWVLRATRMSKVVSTTRSSSVVWWSQ